MKYIFVILMSNLVLINNSFSKDLKLESLDSISKILIANIDHDLKICDLNSEESKILINVLHAQIDQTAQAIIGFKKHKDFLFWDKFCQVGCHCEFYMGLLERDLSDVKVKATYERLKIESQKTTPQNEKLCLERAKSLCKSSMMKKIKKEAKDFTPAPGI